MVKMQLIKLKDKDEIIGKDAIEIIKTRLQLIEAKVKFLQIQA